MTNYTLNPEEQDILHAADNGVYIEVSNLDERREELRGVADDTLRKSKNINIRISERDLQRLKTKAAEEGIPYQTLTSSILHKAISR